MFYKYCGRKVENNSVFCSACRLIGGRGDVDSSDETVMTVPTE